MMALIGAAYTMLAVLMLTGLALILIAVMTLICLALMASTTSPEPEAGAADRREGPATAAGRVEGVPAEVPRARREGPAAEGPPARREGLAARRDGRPAASGERETATRPVQGRRDARPVVGQWDGRAAVVRGGGQPGVW
ncbi:hypothetical protein ACGFIV_05985 [Sphaerisporangium sp. NPDC049003]|uniref:hypothetical protein n=1 Tax=Sphaerisporangium sp. NPDC049003 TaxID=3364517 RepID=UPI00371CB14C